MTTMADVAVRAGVSVATVSRVLSGKTVRPEHARRVREAASELDYALDRTARSLRRRYSDVLALVVPDIENPFFTAVARGVEDSAHQSGLSVVLCNSDDDPDKEDRYLEVAASENMAGVIVAPASPTPHLAPVLRKGRSVVVIDRRVEEEAVDQVVLDNEAVGRAATGQLLQRGARRIACITGPRSTSTAHDRARGWAAALTEAGLEPEPGLLHHATFRVEGGRTATEQLLASAEPPDAVLATNNMVGIGVLQTLSRHRPDPSTARPRVGVIGDLPFATSDVSDLVLLPLRPRELGVRAAQMFLERLGGLAGPGRQVVLTGPE